MQRHRKKDRTERAPPTIQKYLHSSTGSPISNSTPVPATNENVYQSCVGGNTGKTGLVCCRKDDLMFHVAPTPGRGSYPEDDPDSIEVYKEHQQKKHDDQRSIEGTRTQEKHFASKWCAANVSQLPRQGGDMTTSLGDALLHHRQQEQQQQLLSCHSNILSSGSAEYSYAYCEPMLLQRPNGDNSAEQQLHTPVSTLSSSGSSYCVPVYAQRQLQHPPSLPLLQRSFRQPSARNPYQYTYGPTQGSGGGSGNNTTTTTLHHHHHHHHHHSNYTLPNATTGSTATTTTGSLRALFSNIFRKSSSSATPSTAAHSAPFLDVGDSGTLQRSSFGGGSSLLGAERHSFTTCYGTKENIYEDIGSQTGLGALGEESVTRDPPVTGCGGPVGSAPPPLPPSGAGSPTAPLTGHSVAAEWRRVQVQHERVIGELNLSVERLIMPSCDDEYSQQKDQPHHYHQYTVAEIRECKPIIQNTFCLPSVGFDSDVVGSDGTNAGSIGGLRVGSKRLFPAATPTSSSSPTPPTQGVGSERHSPTVSYGKSYGDVDSGISSSSTSGTSYSSSILYRSITNYQQQQQHTVGKEANVFGSRQQHPQRTKHGLFSLQIGTAGTPATMFASGNRATCCRGPKDQMIETRAGGYEAAASGSTNAAVTNAPDPPPPPDNSLITYVCPTSDGSYGPMTRVPHSSVSSQTLTSCCFLSDHNLSECEIAMRPFASTHTYHQQRNVRADQLGSARNGSGNFWARFRKLRLPTGSGGKLFSASERQIDTELHLEDFTGESMWPEPGPRPVYHRQLLNPTSAPHRVTLLPLDAHIQCALPPTAPLNGILPPTPHQRTLHPFVVAAEPESEPIHGPNRSTGDVNDGSEIAQQRSCSPSTPSSIASTASSGSSSSSSVSPSSPMSPVSSSSCSSGAKHSGNENT